MTTNKNNFVAYTLLFVQPIFMASNLIIARGGTELIPPISLAFWRWFFCFIILLPFTFVYLKNNFQFYKKELLRLFVLGFLGCGICGAFPFIAGKTTTIVNMGIIYSSSPIFIIVISSMFFKERLSIIQLVGIFVCLVGVISIIIKANFNLLINLKFTIGDLWMLGASLGWALYTIYLFHWKSKLPLFQRFTLISMFGAISLMPFFIIENVIFMETNYDSNFFIWVVFAALSPSIIAFLLFNFVNKKLGASITGSVLYLYTVYGAIYGFFFFNEKLEIYHLIGSILVFIGIFLVKKNVQKI